MMNITPILPIDKNLIDAKLTPEIKVGEILEGIVEDVLENKTYLFKIKEFIFKARSPLTLKKHDRVYVEVKSLEPMVIFKVLPPPTKTPHSQQIDKINQSNANYLYFTASNLSILGMNKLVVKRYETDEEVSPKGTKSEYEAMDILLEMSALGKVLVKISRQGKLTYYQISVEDKVIKEFIGENIEDLLTDLKNAGYVISHINCTINPNLKTKNFNIESTLTKTEKGYSRLDVSA